MGEHLKSTEAEPSRLRIRILAGVCGLVILSLLASALSLFRITELNHAMDTTNRVVIPLSRIATQMKSDAEILKREPVLPPWTIEVLENQRERGEKLLARKPVWISKDAPQAWESWTESLRKALAELKAVPAGNPALNPVQQAALQSLHHEIEWSVSESDRWAKQNFAITESQLSELQTGLQLILIVVVALSLGLLWFGERALRPLAELTELARQITLRGLQKSDKSKLPALNPARDDEISQLAREFHSMATALLEREKTVEQQKERLQDQNRRLKEMSQMEVRLQEAENLATIGRLSAQVAHEVRNPLHAIGLEAEMALEFAAQAGHPELKSSLQSILLSVERLNKMTENYLKYARISSGEKREIDLGEILENALASYAIACQAKGLEVDWSREAGRSYKMLGDPEGIERAIGNLFQNAIQAVKEHEGKIECRLYHPGASVHDQIVLEIRDNGPGFSSEARERLFTPFFTTKAQGTGIGLSYTRKVIEDHGGQIELLSDTSGAAFRIALPVANLERESSKAKGVQNESNLTRG